MLIAGLLIAVLYGWVRGGRIERLVKLPVRHIYLLILSLAAEAVQSQLLLKTTWMTQGLSFGMTGLQYLLLFLFIFINRHLWEVLACGAGALLNFIAIAANGGAMPLTAKVLALGGYSSKFIAVSQGRYYTYQIVNESTQLKWLGDVILIPGPLPQCISAGDIVLVAGLFLLVTNGMIKEETATMQD
jgi:hypothetical protein